MNANLTWLSFPSPVGPLTAFSVNSHVSVLEWGRAPEAEKPAAPVLVRARDQLNDYFDGRRQRFDLPLAPAGSDFQLASLARHVRHPLWRDPHLWRPRR